MVGIGTVLYVSFANYLSLDHSIAHNFNDGAMSSVRTPESDRRITVAVRPRPAAVISAVESADKL